VDLPRREDSGLVQALKILRGIRGISIIRFDQRDIIRHRLVKSIVTAYDEAARTPDKPDTPDTSDTHRTPNTFNHSHDSDLT